MITLDKARAIVLKHVRRTGVETREAHDAWGGVLAERIKAPHPIPRFDASAVDGYAIRTRDFADAGGTDRLPFTLGGIQRAGDSRRQIVRRCEAVRILTGAMIPRNADAVIMQENARRSGSRVAFTVRPHAGENIRRAGAEFAAGAVMLPAGTNITPPVAGLLATAGRTSVRVRRRPRVALIVTGDELRDPGKRLRPGEIADSNSSTLLAALAGLDTRVVLHRRVKDSTRALRSTFSSALRMADVVIVAGGVSVGDYDLVRDVFESVGVRQHFWRIAVKPGKPVYFGTRKRTLVFGLPGNPVGALLMFESLVAPAIRKMAGRDTTEWPVLRARLVASLKKQTGRLELVRAILTPSRTGRPVVTPVRGQESHMLGGLALSNCVVLFSAEKTAISRGNIVDVLPLPWNQSQR